LNKIDFSQLSEKIIFTTYSSDSSKKMKCWKAKLSLELVN